MPSALWIFTSGVRDWKYRRRMKKMSWNRDNWERQKEEKMEKDNEIFFELIESWVLALRDLSLEGVERLCQADMTWKLVPLYYCPGKEREACIVFVYSQLAVLMFSSSSTSFQIGLFINGNKMMSYLKEHGESGIHSSLFKGSPVQLRNMSDTLEVLWYLPVTHLAALLWTISSWSSSLWLVLSPSLGLVIHFGSHTVLQYSSFGRTSDL